MGSLEWAEAHFFFSVRVTFRVEAVEKPADPRRLRQMVIDLLEADLASDGYDLVDVRIFQGGGRHQLRLYVDAEGGVTLAGCTAASRTVSMLLEEADFIPGPYVIEVSSPGIRRPLRTAAHFAAAVGSDIELKMSRGHQPARLRGKLQDCADGRLLIEVVGDQAEEAGEATVTSVNLDQVLEANLEPEFDVQALINADRRARKDAKRSERRSAAEAKRSRGRNRKKRGDGSPPNDLGGEKD